ncbi:Myosin regulatory light chain [Operophtera brumata]|uniref:Myosin regulatory light chain n=1 Tax=Operophtera brumata TaxID=104452 RepID=A0A0L7KYF5_OPEBR|nr:Myosin regulatory light chain [Operophtera brumata]
MAPKKGKDKKAPPAPKGKKAPPEKPKKIPPPPACFSNVPIKEIPLMLRKLGFNPKTAEINQLYVTFLEDDMVDTVEYHEWLFMIEAKMGWGDDFEVAVTRAFAALGQDDEETGICDFELLTKELFTWGEPLEEIEFMDWIKLATKDKTFNLESNLFCYTKFVENMNNKDVKYVKEPINFFKLDQKVLAEMANKKAAEERAEEEKKDAEKKVREEAKRQKMIADGLLPPD